MLRIRPGSEPLCLGLVSLVNLLLTQGQVLQLLDPQSLPQDRPETIICGSHVRAGPASDVEQTI